MIKEFILYREYIIDFGKEVLVMSSMDKTMKFDVKAEGDRDIVERSYFDRV